VSESPANILAVYRDLRALTPQAFGSAAAGHADGCVFTAWQAASLPAAQRESLAPRALVTVPDFLNYARLLNTGQARAMLELPGSLVRSGLAGMLAGPAIAARPHRLLRGDFWLIAEALVRYDLALVPRELRRNLLLHPYLADFAFAFGQRAFMERFFALAGAGAGVHTQQLAACANCLARWNLRPASVAFLCPPGHEEIAATLAAMRGAAHFGSTRFLGDGTNLPADLQDPATLGEIWPQGLDGTLLRPAG
jgi:hypothetical protein